MAKEKLSVSIDGRTYPGNVEADLNSKAHAVFGHGAGKAFLTYLESISTQSIHPAGTNIEVLAHAEGARWLVAVIKRRTELGRKSGQ